MLQKVRDVIESCKRVLIACKKPSIEEFKDYLKECLVGVAIIGLIGFLFYLIFSFVRI